MIKYRNIKKAYVIPCPSAFRDKVDILCRRKKVNAGDIARSVILMIPEEMINDTEDPGEPSPNDREPSSPSSKIRRKPRIQVRIPEGYSIKFIRKALNLALIMAGGDKKMTTQTNSMKQLQEENEKLKTIISSLMFEPLKNEITSLEEAYYILGFRPFSHPSLGQIKQKFRMLATIHHPDGELGSHERMSQINQAMDFLNKKGKL